MLGCGTGELDFEIRVRPLMEKFLFELSIPALNHVGWIRTGTLEHRDATRIREPLNLGPARLPFDEVWQDIGPDGTRELVDFRQQLWDRGLTHAGMAPNLRHLS